MGLSEEMRTEPLGCATSDVRLHHQCVHERTMSLLLLWR